MGRRPDAVQAAGEGKTIGEEGRCADVVEVVGKGRIGGEGRGRCPGMCVEVVGGGRREGGTEDICSHGWLLVIEAERRFMVHRPNSLWIVRLLL